jgi:hypothetical protein
MHILDFSKFVSSQPEPCEQNHEFLLRRANWSWTDALDPLDRDSLVAVNPGFIRRLYHQWSLEFMDYEVPIAVDLLSRYEVSCTPFNPLELAIFESLPTSFATTYCRAGGTCFNFSWTDEAGTCRPYFSAQLLR